MSVFNITPDPETPPVVQELEEVLPETPQPLTEPVETENYMCCGRYVYCGARLAQILEVGEHGYPTKVRMFEILPEEDIFLHHDLLSSLGRIRWVNWEYPLGVHGSPSTKRTGPSSTHCFPPTIPVVLYSQLVQEIMHTLRGVAIELAIRQPQRPLMLQAIEDRLIELWCDVCSTATEVTPEGIAVFSSFYHDIMNGIERLVKNSLPVIAQGMEVCDYRLGK